MNKEGFEIKFTLFVTALTFSTMAFVYFGMTTVGRFV